MSPKLLLSIATVASLLILENYFPFFPFKNSVVRRVSSNFYLGLITAIPSNGFMLGAAKYINIRYPTPGLMGNINSPVLAIGLSLLVLDLYMYIWHRSMHTFSIAWRFHRVHHTDLYMNVSTAYRFHAIEVISSNIPKLVLIWCLGITAQHILIYESLFAVIVALHHSNLALPFEVDRWLAHIIVSPNYHRIHHSQIVTETNSNYGSVFTCWDWLFGSYRDRDNIAAIELGVNDETRELHVWQLLTIPFVRSSNPSC
jgi:sterol desaturase/sphingolipid hydroxylase (fatty acid hydroxylase superfamily)